MATLQMEGGGSFDTATLPCEDTPELWEAVVGLSPLLDPLDEDEAAIDPLVFLPDLRAFLAEALGRGRKAPPLDLEFRRSGRIGETSYWVFELLADRNQPMLYGIVVHNPPAGELACVEAGVTVEGMGVVVLSPEQAALSEYLQSDSLTLREQYKRDGPRAGDDRES